MFCTLEVNFLRLLHRSENFINHKVNHSYINKLETLFKDLISSDYRPNLEIIRSYELRLKKLNNAKELLEKKAGKISPDAPITPVKFKSFVPSSCSIQSPSLEIDNYLELQTSTDSIIHNSITDTSDILAIERQHIHREMREQLLGEQQQNGKMMKSTNNSAHLLQEQRLKREQLTSEMLALAHDLKDQSYVMGQRLRSDFENVEGSIEQAGRNTAQLSNVLSDLSKEIGSRCGYLVLFLLIISIILFNFMIFIMKMFRK